MRTRSRNAVAKQRIERKLAVESIAPKASEPESEPDSGSPAKSSEQSMDEEVEPPSPTAVPVTKSDQSEDEEAQASNGTESIIMEARPTPPRTRRVVKKVVRMVKKRQLKVSTTPTPQENVAEEVAESAKVETEGSTKVEMAVTESVDAGEIKDSEGENVEKSSEREDHMVINVEPVGENKSQMEDDKHVGKEEEIVVRSPEAAQPNPDAVAGIKEKSQIAVELDLSAKVTHNSEEREELVKAQCQADLVNPGGSNETEVIGGNTSSAQEEDARDEVYEGLLDLKVLKEVPKETMEGSVVDKGQCEGEADAIIPEGGNETEAVGGSTSSAGQGECAHDQGHRGPDEDKLIEDDNAERAGDVMVMEEEHKQLTAVAEERKTKKEYEIFVGGLDMDATEEHVKKAFEYVGPVVEVRLYKDLSTDKKTRYAFVRFSIKEHVKRALSEMKNPVICGKRCATAPSEDNDTLFLGNICNTWTKEAIRQRLKDYGVERVESINLVYDTQHEGRNRGFAFLEFSCHADAMLAYKRLQKPDAVFGHPERTAKVAFAEPISEPDPQVMAEVKTVFLDGLPLSWDEHHLRERLKGYGEITRIALARNMPTAKRKDFGFVDFSTHGAANSCINGINDAETSGGNSMAKVRARLSNPVPKTQAVKGGMRGGFLISHVGRANTVHSSRSGRGVARGGRQFNSTNIQRGRGFYQRGRGQTYRVGPEDYGLNNRYDTFHGRTPEQGGRWAPLGGSYQPADRGVPFAGPYGSNVNRTWHHVHEGMPSDQIHFRRQPFSEGAFDGPYGGRPYEDPYLYHERMHGMKRPFYMTEPEPDYGEPSRYRPRMDYSNPGVPYNGAHYPDTYPNRGAPYPHDYYGSDHRPYPPYFGGDRGYRGGYYR
ncbi:Heterogeneous nuclear ribonucleoprotein Q [Linum grandiflorum]